MSKKILHLPLTLILLTYFAVLVNADCTESINITQPCNVSNEQILNITYTPNGCDTDVQGPYSCIYCSPLWVARTGSGYDCQPNGTRYVEYDDYSICCLDSPMNCIYPSDNGNFKNCVYFQNDMECQYDAKPYIQNKINFACTIPQQFLNYTPPEGAINNDDSVNCITYVRKINQSLLIQSNPEYTEATTLQFWKESERRHSFTNAGRLINAYYTDKALETDQDFTLGMRCTTADGTILVSEYTITPVFKTPTYFVNRLAWIGNNWPYIIITLIGTIGLIFFIGWAVHKVRKG